MASCSATCRYRVVKHSAGSAYKQIMKYLLNNYKEGKQLDLPKTNGQTTSSDFEARVDKQTFYSIEMWLYMFLH